MSHLLQPLDQRPFATSKAAYAQVLKGYDPTGGKCLWRAECDLLWQQARIEAFTEENIKSGWRGACLHPHNLPAMLNRRGIANHSPTTPDLLLERTVERSTPKNKRERKPMIHQMLTPLPPEAASKLHRIERHLDAVETEVKLLRNDLQLYRAKDNKAEGKQVRSRIQKTNDLIITSFRDVAKARGG